MADDPPASAIVVTARREAERAQDVPLKLDVIEAEAIGTGGVDGLQALAARVPGLSFENVQGGGFSIPVLRSQHQPSIAGDAAAVFVDGVYQLSRDSRDIEPLDLERIEVVHGPQSALFGHSSFSGAIHYVPAQPTEQTFVRVEASAGSDDFERLQAIISGPLDARFKARLAVSWGHADGTWRNAAAPTQSLGDSDSYTLAATIATHADAPFELRLSGRFGQSRSNQQPFFALGAREYNCGARNPASGVWSYFCGVAPLGTPSLSPGLSLNRNRVGQLALHLTVPLGGIELLSDSSFYQSSSTTYRDSDGTAAGELYGVCQIALNCTPPGSVLLPVIRLQAVNRVGLTRRAAREFAQELRLRGGSVRLDWQLGAVLFASRARTIEGFGAARGALATNERFTSLVLSDPSRVGPVAFVNNALVANPDAVQLAQNVSVERRRTVAIFATAEYRLAETLRIRGEARANWERLDLDSQLSNFQPSFGTSLGARHFFDATPRLSIDYRPASGWLAYASYARGSRSGGINAMAGLLPEEQSFEPETNWTAELGGKYAGAGAVRSAGLTLYHIDWRNTQILGFPITPGATSLITRNTKGIETWGVELAGELTPTDWLGIDGAFSYAHPRFKRGSEDPGGAAFCGISANLNTSNFCTIVASAVLPGQLVPDISGNRPARAVATSFSLGVTLAPARGWMLRVDLSHQGNVYDRQIEGLKFGTRTLLGARLSLSLGPVTAELWGSNLLNDLYVRAAGGGGGRASTFYLGQPRPVDFILGEGRRIGLTVSYTS